MRERDSGLRAASTAGALWKTATRPAELDVVGMGECSLDTVCEVDEWPHEGGKLEVASWNVVPGGQVASALLGCTRLGLKTGYIGSVGADAAAEPVLSPLRRAGVDLESVRAVPGAETRHAFILVSRKTGERSVLSHRDPHLDIPTAQLRRSEITRARCLLVDTTDPDASLWAASIARAESIPVVLEADAVYPGVDQLLTQVDFPVVAREFAEEMGGTGSVRDGLRALAERGARLAVVTLADQGALARADDVCVESPAFRIAVRDTTGAGDAFHAGFIWALLEGADASMALRTANAVAALSCEAAGAQDGLRTDKDVNVFLETAQQREWRDPDT